MSLRTTASQTVGPYLHIGLTWLVTDNLLGPDVTGDRITIEGRITDADGKPVDDALVEIWQANAHGRYDHPDDTQDLPLDPGFKGFGRVPTDADGRFRFTTIKPGPVPTPGRVLSAAGPSQGANSTPSGGSAAAPVASVGVLSAAGPSQGANSAPSGGSAAAPAASVGVLSAAGPSQGANSAPSGGSAAAPAAPAASVGVVMQAPHINVTIFMRGMLKHLKTRLYFPDDPANATDPVLARVPAERRGTLIAAPRGSGALEWNVVLQGCGETVFFDY